jgi:dTDP-L-rhamnose 4-epimerase
MKKTILITGGAGFVGLRVARALLKQSDTSIRILDNFSPQIHAHDQLPDDLIGHVELIKADVRDREALRRSLSGVDSILHLAAETGTGQSMYEIEHYFSVNVQATAAMLDLLQNDACGASLKSIVIASSRAVYGEGAYHCPTHRLIYPTQRTRTRLSAGQFDPICPICSATVSLQATPESAPFMPMSVYGLTKQVQEQSILLFAQTKGINGFALRYQNVYGPGQSLKNPYTGILAVFSNLARQNQTLEIYEDGLESRDFIYIDDVVEATVRSINYSNRFIGALNIGSGQATNVLAVAQEVKAFFKSNSAIKITGAFRMGDIRHNIADTQLMGKVLNYAAKTGFKEGMHNFLTWATHEPEQDKNAYAKSVAELTSRGLMNGA